MKLRGNGSVTPATAFAAFAMFAAACGGEPAPSLPPPLTGAVSVSVGATHACAVLGDGTLRCWGSNFSGELGDGSIRPSSWPVAVTLVRDAAAVEAADDFTCALRSGGGVSCWGVSAVGQTGIGDATLQESTPRSVSGLSGPVSSVSAGEESTVCASLVSGTVECWGLLTFARGPDAEAHRLGLAAIPGLSGVRSVAVNGTYACALLQAGTVSCWGSGPLGQPDGTTTSLSQVPVAVPGLSDVVELSLGSTHACARDAGGGVKCWGWLPGSAPWDSATPVTVDALAGAISLASGEFSACVVRSGGTVRCVGGALDDPRAVPGVDHAVSVSVGPSSACAVIDDGTIRCWGDGDDGQLGDGRPVLGIDAPPALSAVRVVAPKELED